MEPLLPILRMLPALPMLRIEPVLPMLRIDPLLNTLSTLAKHPAQRTLNALPTLRDESHEDCIVRDMR